MIHLKVFLLRGRRCIVRRLIKDYRRLSKQYFFFLRRRGRVFIIKRAMAAVLIGAFRSTLFMRTRGVELRTLSECFQGRSFPFRHRVNIIGNILIRMASRCIARSLVIMGRPIIGGQVFFRISVYFWIFFVSLQFRQLPRDSVLFSTSSLRRKIYDGSSVGGALKVR